MDFLDSGKRQRRRGRQNRRRHQATFDRLPPGRAPIGIPSSQVPSVPAATSRAVLGTIEPTITKSLQSDLEVRAENCDTGYKSEPELSTRTGTHHQVQSCHFLNPKANMSSFGAMARQAEYLAATNAKQRQVSREAEEQKLPPRPVPIKLSAFTKVPQPSRNKGAKAWKPLTLDDIDEDTDDFAIEEEEQRSPTPLSQTSSAREIRSPTSGYKRILLRGQEPLIRFSSPQSNIPTGPRAVTDARDRSVFIANPVPQRPQQHPIINMPLQQPRPGLQSVPMCIHHGGFPHPNYHYPMYHHSPAFHFAGSPQGQEWHDPYGLNTSIVPNDISPTKQEEKFAALSRLPDHHPTQYDHYQQQTTYSDPYPQMGQPPSQPIGHDGDFYLQDQVQAWNQSLGGRDHYGSFPHEMSKRGSSETDTTLPESNNDDRRTTSSASFVNPSMPAQVITVKIPSTVEARPLHVPEGQNIPKYETLVQTPYDRRSEMQSYLTTTKQEAMAKKTKTVLHNPELHRQQDNIVEDLEQRMSDSANQQGRRPPQPLYESLPWAAKLRPRARENVPWEVMPPPASVKEILSKIKFPVNLSAEKSEAIAKAINNPAPGLSIPELDGCTEAGVDHQTGSGLNNDQSNWPPIGSDDWCELKPPSAVSRERIRRLMAKAAAEITHNALGPLFDPYQQTNNSSASSAMAWFHENKRGVQGFAQQIAEKNAIEARDEATRRNGGLLPANFNDGFAANLLVAEVVLNVKSYFDPAISVQEQRANFFKVKAVPEYAIERGGLLTGMPQNVSYFDDNQDGFGVAPVRIARDPRFRPHGKDGNKIKLEEEWKHRHEMYGRKLSETWKCM